jgi:hypothetical protein
MMLSAHRTISSRILAAIALLFFVVYCSVGVCTNWVGSSNSDPVFTNDLIMDHSQHQSGDAPMSDMSHCGSDESGCDWGRNLVADPVQDADPSTSFFVLYLLSASILLVMLWRQLRLSGPFVRERVFLRGYPRLHIQHAVFLN